MNAKNRKVTHWKTFANFILILAGSASALPNQLMAENPSPQVQSIDGRAEAGPTEALFATLSGGVADAAKVKALLDQGANINARDKNGATPLFLVLEMGYPSDITKFLLDKGAAPNLKGPTGLTPLSQGLCRGSDTVKALLDKGADVKAVNNDKTTALEMALSLGCKTDIIGLLLDKGADPNGYNAKGFTLLNVGLSRGPDTIKALLDKGAAVNAANSDGKTVLSEALLSNGYSDGIELLLKAGANVNAINKDGSTPFKIALGIGNETNIELLRKYGAQ